MAFKTREYTNKILEMVEEGVIDKDWLIQALLTWTSERDVQEFYEKNELGGEEEEDEDPMDDYNYVGSPHHY